MILWPDDAALNAHAKAALALFRQTGASLELEASPHAWRVVAWPWNDEPPLRVVLEDEAHDETAFVLGDDGVWALHRIQSDFLERSTDALAREASGPTVGVMPGTEA